MIGLIADDLTGACDTGVQFLRAGLTTWVSVQAFTHSSFPNQSTFDVMAINTDSRQDPPLVAASKVLNAADDLLAIGAMTVYKKIDSALRGNVAAEVMSLIAGFRERIALVAPAYPAQGRTTLDGHQLVDGVRVSESEFAHDALTPVMESHIPTLLAGAGSTLGTPGIGAQAILSVSLAEVRRGDHLKLHIPSGIRCIVFDAVDPSDLTRIAQFAANEINRYFLVGTAGLAQAFADVLASTARPGGVTPSTPCPRMSTPYSPTSRAVMNPVTDHRCPKARPGLVVSGSMKTISRQQIDLVVKGGADLVEVPVSEIAGGVLVPDLVTRLTDQVVAGLQAGRDVVLTVGSPTSNAFIEGQPLDALEMSRQINAALGQTTAHVLQQVQTALSGLVLNGGDTALSVCDALEIDFLNLRGELFPGIVCCKAENRVIPFVLKSGGFGETKTLVDLLDRLKQSEHVLGQ